MLSLAAQWAMIAPLVIATGLGALMGLERSVAGKQAGMRTYALVALGSSLFTLAGVAASYSMSVFAGVNPLQLAGSVIIGVGFIGAGLAAMRHEDHVELTTAAGIFVSAAVGVACGLGLWPMAVVAAVLSVLIFSIFLRIENAIRHRLGRENQA